MKAFVVLLGALGLCQGLQHAFQFEAPSFQRFFGREEYEEEEEVERPFSGGVAKVVIGAGVAVLGGAGAFAVRAIQAKRKGTPANKSPRGAFGAVKGGSETMTEPRPAAQKMQPDSQVATPAPLTATAAAQPQQKGVEVAAADRKSGGAAAAAAEAAMKKELEEEEEEVFEVEEVVKLDESSLSRAQKDHPLARILGPKLVRYDEGQGRLVEMATADALEGKTVGLFFHAQQVEAVLEKMKAGKALPPLKDIYQASKDARNDFEMVFVGLPDGQEGRWQKYVKEMPWLAVPHDAVDIVKDVYRNYKVQNFPSVMIVDGEGKVLNEKGYTYMLLDRAGFPWKALTVSEMIGNRFTNRENETLDASAVSPEKAKVLGLYFSASWCKPCRDFTPRLAELYNKFNADGKELEVVLVGVDEDEAKHREYLQEMPWLAVPLDDKQRRSLLMMEYEVRSLPTLILLDEDRNVITTRGREFALKDPQGDKFPWRPEPLNEISYSVEGIAQKPAVCVFMEGASSDAQEKIVADLGRLAGEYDLKSKVDPEDSQYRFGFYYAKEISTISRALRAVTGLEQISPKDKFLKSKAEANKPVVVLFDIAKEMFHVSDMDDINESSIRALMEAKLDDALPMEAFKQPEGAADAAEASSV